MSLIEILESNIFANIMQLFIALFGSAAFLTYLWQKNEKLKTAATLIINQVDESERIVDLIRKPENKDNRVIYKSPDIIQENYWQEYKILFMGYLDESDIEIIERYYANISLIQRGKERLMADLSEAWKGRSLEYNIILREIAELRSTKVKEDDILAQKQLNDSIDEKECAVNIFLSEERIFRAGVGLDMLLNGYDCFESIKGKSVYQRLKKKSFRK